MGKRKRRNAFQCEPDFTACGNFVLHFSNHQLRRRCLPWRYQPVKNIIDFGFYVSFFPQLVAGPIVRASGFIKQIYEDYHVSKAEFGWAVFMILKGLVKKIFIGDYIAVNFVDRVFSNPLPTRDFENLMALFGYSLQVYVDFSGYTDIAIGVALLMGFRLPQNFNAPYKAKNVANSGNAGTCRFPRG
jgi:alginate O-acetyltransferase complex protein AlgI